MQKDDVTDIDELGPYNLWKKYGGIEPGFTYGIRTLQAEIFRLLSENNKLREAIKNVNFTRITRSVEGLFGSDVEYVYICPFCGATAQILDNLHWCHDDDCPVIVFGLD
jgi:hypothetical protein